MICVINWALHIQIFENAALRGHTVHWIGEQFFVCYVKFGNVLNFATSKKNRNKDSATSKKKFRNKDSATSKKSILIQVSNYVEIFSFCIVYLKQLKYIRINSLILNWKLQIFAEIFWYQSQDWFNSIQIIM